MDIASVMSCSFFISLQSLLSILKLELPFSILSSALHIVSFLFLFLIPTTPNFLATSSNTGLVSLSHFNPPIFIIPSLSYVIFIFFVFLIDCFFAAGFLFGFLKQQSYPCGFFLVSKPSLHGGLLGLGHVDAFSLPETTEILFAFTFLLTNPKVYPFSCNLLTSSTPTLYAISISSGLSSPCI